MAHFSMPSPNADQNPLRLIAHEMCTPLSLIKLHAESLQERCPPGQKPALQAIEQLSQDLFDMAQCILNAHPPATQIIAPINLHQFCQGIKRQFQPLLQSKSQNLIFDIPHNIEVPVSTIHLKIWLHNLLSNALKFSPNGSTITVYTQASPLALVVKDQAQTIPASERESIFNCGQKGSQNQTQVGFGLGLYLCRSIAESQDLAVWTQPHLDGGNAFYLTLPLATV